VDTGNGDGSVRELHEYVVSGISLQWPVRPREVLFVANSRMAYRTR